MGPRLQEGIALGIVALVAAGLVLRTVRKRLARWLLRRGCVRLAMRLQFGATAGCCDDDEHGGPPR